MGYGGKNKKFHPAAGSTSRLQMRKAAPTIGHRCPVAELAGVEFVITDDYNPRFRFAQDNVDEFENSALPRDRRCGQRRNDPMIQPLLARARLTFR
jgi:hypothetical protein